MKYQKYCSFKSKFILFYLQLTLMIF